MNITDLKEKPLWQMTGEEFLFLQQNAGQPTVQPPLKPDTSKKYVYGICGIAKLFGCSMPTANRIKQSGKSTRLLHKSDVKSLLMQNLPLS